MLVFAALALLVVALVVSLIGQARSRLASGSLDVAAAAAARAPSSANASVRRSGDASAGASVWVSAGCGGCHVLATKGGTLGPSLDETKPSLERVVDVVTNGFGGMTAFGGQLSETEIQNVASYVVQQTAVAKPAKLVRFGIVFAQPRARIVVARVRCVVRATGSCKGNVTLRATVKVSLLRNSTSTARLRKVVLGKTLFAVSVGREKAVRVRFNRAGKRLLKKLGTKELRRLRVTVKATARDGSGLKRTASKTLTL
jgi:mono/diheme cytochrome c family protein